MSQEIDKVIQRTRRYYYEDGLVETAVGLIFFIIGLALLGWLTVQSSPALGISMVILSALLIFGGILFVQKIIPRLKDRLVHPRTGKIIYRREEPKTKLRWPVYVMLAALVSTLFLPEQFNQIAFMEGAFLAAVFILMGYRLNLPRYYVLGIAALLMSVIAVSLFANEIISSAFTFSGVGLIVLVSGLIVLSRYLRQHPQVEVDYE
ncbi:MAG: hypothetical protein GY803_07185 [Chloroflexi bacterium]|nr:hypothetical protein [Chloroflexota bacterium]